MRVFLSYSHEQKPVAEEIQVALSVRGHDVFFAPADLSPGREYDLTIERAIAEQDAFVFLISSASVKPGSYAQTELSLAKAKWKNPSGKVLPVMAQPTLLARVDAYLRAVTILYPQGNLAAEVAAAVDNLSKYSGEYKGASAEIQRERIAAYKELWRLTRVLPKWPRLETVKYSDLEEFSRALRKWYFVDGGGMLLSSVAYTSYAALQDSLTAIRGENLSGSISDEHYDAIRELCSALRNRLAHDVGARE